MNVSSSQSRAGFMLLAVLLACLPAIGILAPRALSFLPALAGFSGFFLLRFAQGSWPVISRSYASWMMALTVLILCSALWSIDPPESFERGLKIFPVLAGGVFLSAVVMRLDLLYLEKIAACLPFAVLLGAGAMILNIACDGFLNAWLGDPLPRDQGLAPGQEGFNLAPLNRGVMVAVFAAMAAAGYLKFAPAGIRKIPPRIMGALLAAVIGGLLLQTDSQSAQLAVAVALIMFFAFPYRSKIAWRSLAVFIAALVMAAPFLAHALYSQAAPLIADQSWFKDGYAAARFEIWDFIARRALENPLLGHGAEATRAMTFDHARLYHASDTILHPHNFALQMWIEFGAAGALFAASFLIWLVMAVRRLDPGQARFLLPLLIAVIAAAATSYGLWQGWWIGLFTLLAAYGQILFRISQKH